MEKYIIYGAEDGKPAVLLKEIYTNDKAFAARILKNLQEEPRYMFTYLWMEPTPTKK